MTLWTPLSSLGNSEENTESPPPDSCTQNCWLTFDLYLHTYLKFRMEFNFPWHFQTCCLFIVMDWSYLYTSGNARKALWLATLFLYRKFQPSLKTDGVCVPNEQSSWFRHSEASDCKPGPHPGTQSSCTTIRNLTQYWDSVFASKHSL